MPRGPDARTMEAVETDEDERIEAVGGEPAPRALVRRPDRRLIAGVAGGLADATGSDPIWWRLGFVVLAPVGGLGVLLYLLMWFIVPRADLPRSAGQRFVAHFPDAPSWFGLSMLVLGAALLANQIGLWSPPVAWAFVLIGLGVMLFRREAERTRVVVAGTTETPLWTPSPSGPAEPWEGPTIPPPPAGPPRAPRPKRERSWLGWLALGLALVGSGVMWMLRDAGVAEPSLAQMLALPLAIFGVALLAGAFAGRARWLVLFGLLLVPMVLVASVIRVPLNGTWHDRTFRPRTVGELATSYEQSGGRLELDLSDLRAGDVSSPVRVSVAIGQIRVVLPSRGMPVTIVANVGIGEINGLNSGDVGGLGVSRTMQVEGVNPLQLDLEAGIGVIDVFRAGPGGSLAGPNAPASRPASVPDGGSR
jgi:phage shock protein PspC (stress-responsive transcriptional regulator)